MKLQLGFLLVMCVSFSTQCDCPYWYTQQILCDSEIIMNATIDGMDESPDNVDYQISISAVYKGENLMALLADNGTLRTPSESSACGPLTLENATSYYMTANIYDDGMMHSIFCDYVQEESFISPDALQGIENGFYLSNCDCKILSTWGTYPSKTRRKQRCGLPGEQQQGCFRDSLCIKNKRGKCKWQPCSSYT